MNLIPVVAIMASLTAAAYAGAGHYGSSQLKDSIAQLQEGRQKTPGLELAVSKNNSGLFESSGELLLSLDRKCLDQDIPLGPSAILSYRVSHAPTLAGLASFDAELKIPKEQAEAWSKMTGSNVLVKAHGQMTYSTHWSVQFQTPGIEYASDGRSVSIAGTSGLMNTDGQAVEFTWDMPQAKLSTRADGEQLTVTGLKAHIDMRDPVMGIGKTALTINSITSQSFVANDISIVSETSENLERLSSFVQPNIRMIRVNGEQADNLGFRFAMQGLDASGIRQLSSLGNGHCGAEMLTEEKLLGLENALAQIINTGMRISLNDVAGTHSKGSVAARMEFVLAPASNTNDLPLASRIGVRGHLVASQALLTPEQLRMAKRSGFIREDGDRLVSEWSFIDGEAKLNGRRQNPEIHETIRHVLGIGDEQMGQWHSGLARGKPMFGDLMLSLR